MNKASILTDAEWKLMKLRWEESPRTVAQMVKAMNEDTGWTKGTVFMMLTRMADKGVVRYEEGGRSKLYYPVLEKEDAASAETESFLKKVYDGSVGLMVASIAGQKGLSKEDIDELYDILREAEREAKK